MTHSLVPRLSDGQGIEKAVIPVTEIIEPGDRSVRVVVCPRPFSSKRSEHSFPAGTSIGEIVRTIEPDARMRRYFAVSFDGDSRLDEKLWGRIRVKAGTTLIIRAVPQGGGGNKILRMVLMIAVTALAAAATWYIGGLGAPIAAALVGAAITGIGSVLINTFIPLTSPRLKALSSGNESPTLAVTGARNSMNIYGPVPRVYGKHRVVPPYGARPYTELLGKDQYLRLLFDLGYGPLVLSELKIGETPIDNFEGVEYEIRQGFPDDEPLTLYTRSVFEEQLSVLLEEAGGFTTRTTQPNADEISVDVTFLQGLTQFQNNGNRVSRAVTLEAQYSVAGANDWQMLAATVSVAAQTSKVLQRPTPKIVANVLGQGTHPVHVVHTRRISLHPVTGKLHLSGANIPNTYVPICSVTVSSNTAVARVLTDERPDEFTSPSPELFVPTLNGNGSVTVGAGTLQAPEWVITDNSTTAVRSGQIWPVAKGQYDVRIRRVTPDTTDDKIFDKVTWTALRTIRETPPIREKGHCLVAVRIKATDELNGVVDEFNCIASSLLLDYRLEGSPAEGVWAERETANPASIVLDLLTGTATMWPVEDTDLIDYAALEEWALSNIDKGREFNAVIDFETTVFDALRMVCTTGRAAFTMRDGKFSVVRDFPQDTPVQHFTPRNSWGFKGTKAFPDQPHALRIPFVNRNNGWRADERIVYADGHNADTATRFETVDMFGVTDPEQVWKDGRYFQAVAILRPETFELNCDFEHLVAQQGDMVLVTHDVIAVGIASGRVKSVIAGGEGEQVPAVTFDGTNDFMTRGSGLDGAMDSSTGMMSFWFRMNGGNGAQQSLIRSEEGAVNVRRFTDNTWQIQLIDPTFSTLFVVTSTPTFLAGSGWHHFMASWDTNASAGNKIGQVYIDDASVAGTHTDAGGAMDIDYTEVSWAVGARQNATEKLNADIADVAMWFGERLDLSIEANRRKFISSSGDAVDLGANGELPTGSAPIMFFRGPASSFNTNLGTGGDFSVTGALSDAADGPDAASVAAVTGITVDELLHFSQGDDHGVSIRTVGNPRLTAQVENITGSTRTLTFTTPMPFVGSPAELPIAVGDLFGFGILGRETLECLVKTIEPGEELSAQLTMVPHSPGVHEAESGEIPPFDPMVTALPRVPLPPLVVSVDSGNVALVLAKDGTVQSRIAVTVAPQAGLVSAVRFAAQFRPTNSDQFWVSVPDVPATGAAISILPVQDGLTYDIRIRSVSALGNVSEWVLIEAHTVIGKTQPPPRPDSFTVSRLADGTRRYVWTLADPPADVRAGGGFQIRYFLGATSDWTAMTVLPPGFLVGYSHESNELPAGTYTFAIKTVDSSGNESTTARFIDGVVLDDPSLRGVLLQSHEHEKGWPGTKTDCYVDDANVLRAVSAGDWDDLDSQWQNLPATWDDILPRADPISYETEAFDVGADLSFTPQLTANVAGIATLEMKTGTDMDGDVTGAYGPVGAVQGARYIQFRLTISDGSPAIPQAPAAFQFSILLDAEIIEVDLEDIDTSGGDTLRFQSLGTGHFLVSPGGGISTITRAAITAFQNAGAGWTWEVVSKNAAVSPMTVASPAAEFRIYQNGTPADATVDLNFKGVA